MAITLLAAPALAQSDDRGVLQAFLEDNLSDAGREVRIEGFEGALSGRATIEELTIADAAGVWLTVRGAVFDWNRGALLRGALDINELSAREIVMPRAPQPAGGMPAPEASPFALPELPVSVRVGAFTVGTLTLGAPLVGETARFSLNGTAALASGAGTAQLGVERLGGPQGRLAFSGSFSNATRELALNLELTEAADGITANLIGLPGRPSVKLTLDGTGPVSNYTAQLTLATDGTTRITGAFTQADLPDPNEPDRAARAFSAEIGGDLRPLVEEQYQPFFGSALNLAASGTRFADGRLAIEELSLESAAMTLTGAVEIAADGWPARLDLEGRIDPGDDVEVLLSLPGPKTWVAGAEVSLRYDVGRGDAWVFDSAVTRLRRNDLALDGGRITGNGRLSPGVKQVDGAVELALTGIAPQDPALADAIGPVLTGRTGFAWAKGGALRLSALELAGQGYALTGEAGIDGVDGQIDLAIDGDLSLNADDLGRFSGLVGRPVAGRASLTVSGTLAPVSGAFDLGVTGTGRDLATGFSQVDPLLSGTTTLDASARRDTTGLFLESLGIEGDRAEIAASGRLTTGDSDIAFALRLADIETVLPGTTGGATLVGRTEQTGSDWTLTAELTAPGGTTGSVEGVATLVDGTAGPVRGAATLDIGQLASYSGLAGQPISGALALAVTGSGDLRDRTFGAVLDGTGEDLAAGEPRLDPLLIGTTRLSGAVRRETGGVFIDRLSVAGTRATMAAKGRVTPGDSDLTLDLRLAELEVVLPGASGAATLAGRAVQDGPDWTVEADLGAPGGTTAALGGTMTVIDGSPGPVSGVVSVSVGQLSAFAGLARRPVAGGLELTASASGDLRDGTLAASVDGTGQNLATGNAEADLLLRGASTFAMDLRRTPDRVTVFDRFELRTPQLIADLTGSFSADRSRVRYSVDLHDLGLFVTNLNGPVAAEGVISAADGPYSVTSALRGPGGTTASLEGSLARDASSADLAVSGAGPIALGNRFISPNLAEGTAQFDLRLNGPPALSSLSGTVRTGSARLTVPALRTSLAEIAAEARLGGGGADISATASVSTGGRVSLSGRASLSAPFSADLAATLSNVGVRQSGIYETTVDGRLAVSGPLRSGAALTGDLSLGPAEIRIPEGAGTGAGDIEGLVHLNEPPAVRQTRARAGLIETGGDGPGADYPLDLVVRAPSRIFIRGRGLDAELGGELRLSGSTSNVVTEGRFDLIRGRLDILGKRLVLSEAFAQLQGDFDPFVRAVAATQSGDTTIQVIVEGPASSPSVTFTSSPDLPEDEILARLLFGRDLSQISPLQALQLANAVRVLAGGGGEGIVGRLRQNFGLDDLDLAAGEDGAAGVRVGKYISDNIYTDVTVDTSGRSEINLNLTITPSITARGTAASDGNTGVGVFFERDY